jgi:hypothetical protein
MSLASLEKAADECFALSMPKARTREEHEAAIGIWNKLLDDAIENADRARDQFLQEKRYEHALIARDMAKYFKAMKATKDALFAPET